jgi:uncharacterized protein (DUF3084 family)
MMSDQQVTEVAELRSELSRLRAENARLREKLDELRKAYDDDESCIQEALGGESYEDEADLDEITRLIGDRLKAVAEREEVRNELAERAISHHKAMRAVRQVFWRYRNMQDRLACAIFERDEAREQRDAARAELADITSDAERYQRLLIAIREWRKDPLRGFIPPGRTSAHYYNQGIRDAATHVGNLVNSSVWVPK